MKLRDPKSITLIVNELMYDINLAREHSMLPQDISRGLVCIAQGCISSLTEQAVEGVISVNEWHAMFMDVKDIICTMLQEVQNDQN